MMRGDSRFLPDLTARLGADVVATARDELAPYETDHRRLHQGKALALARPRSVDEVATILALCDERRIGVVPVGGNTGYCGGATPDASGTQLLLSLARLNRVRALDALNNSITVEAGCILADVQRAAAAAGRYFPLSLGAEGSCHIGGNLATNAGGLNVLRYGMARDLVLGLEVVLANGQVLSSLGALRKDNTGYDLKSLFVGSEGTLGVITAAVLELFPAQRAVTTALAGVRDVSSAVQLLAQVRAGCGELLSSFEVMPRVAVDLVRRHLPDVGRVPTPATDAWLVLIEASASDAASPIGEQLQALLATCQEAGQLGEVLIASSGAQRDAWWRLRESIPEAQRHDGASLKHDIALPLSRIAEFFERSAPLLARLAPLGYRVAYGHLGDGNLHFNVNQVGGADRNAFVASGPALQRAVHDLVHELGGSISAEHGIGQLKIDELERYAPAAELALMRSVKRAFDPNGILNPGKVLRP